ncbi:MAG: oligoendopeptidase F [Candidatus Zixiibacteriota bacterium]|nr:MAG: oligoendopeptidase F [candidate division Zixibacteria bacterium]
MRQRLIYPGIFVFSLLIAAGSVTPALAEEGAIPERADIDEKYRWRVEDIYATVDDWEKDFTVVEQNLARFEKYRGHLGDSPEILLECLRLADSLGLVRDNLYVFSGLKFDEDTRVSQFQGLTGRAASLWSQLAEATAFVEPELIALGEEKLRTLMEANKDLELYRFYLEDLIRQSKHVLSAEEEALLAMLGPISQGPRNIFTRLEDADLNYGSLIDENGSEVELSYGRIYRFLESSDRRVRRDARIALCSAYVKMQNTIASTLETSLRKDYFYTRARKYNSCLEWSLDANNIPTAVFHNLIDAVNSNIDVMHKWTSVQKKILGVDTLYAWDLYVPLVSEVDKEYTYEEAVAMTLEGLTPMGKDYLAVAEDGLTPGSGWVDVYENQGKASGAYNWGTYTSHPYILMNFEGNLEGVFTLAHELGHAMQTYYVSRNEPYIYEGYSLFAAEVGSGCAEALMMKYLLEHTTDKKEKMYLLNYYIQQIVGTFFTQTLFSEFEIATHRQIENGGAVSAEYFRNTYRDIYQKHRGPELVLGDAEDITGLRISHFYRPFYVYQYAAGYAAAQALSQKVLEGDKAGTDALMEFLSTGASEYPVDALKKAGIDMTTPEPYLRTIQLFSDLVDQMDRLLDEG